MQSSRVDTEGRGRGTQGRQGKATLVSLHSAAAHTDSRPRRGLCCPPTCLLPVVEPNPAAPAAPSTLLKEWRLLIS